jgi:hypothetical protein
MGLAKPQSGSALELLLPSTSPSGIGGKLATSAIPLQWRFAGDLNGSEPLCLVNTPESSEAMSLIATPTFAFSNA